MSSNAFTSLATARLAAQSRAHPNSCCPDKDLILLFSRLGGNDRMSLWNINQGTKKWEADVGDGETSFMAVSVAWSPDGRSIAIARDPPSVAIYSIQDGHRMQVLQVAHENRTIQLSGVWWFTDDDERSKNASNIPDIFKRNQVITGSVHSVLRMLPLLDHMQEEGDNSITATDLFAFQGSHNRAQRSSGLPGVIEKWPTLAADHIAASISTPSYSKSTLEKAELDAMDNLTMKTILLAGDTQGHIFSFLDGIYPLGVVPMGVECDFSPLAKHPSKHYFVGQAHLRRGSNLRTLLGPTVITLPLLASRKARDVAKLSSTARELVWYLLRVVKEMQDAWFGHESQTGARDLGPKWVRALEAKQKEFSSDDEPDSILDLTSLLTTGRASEALSDFLGSGQDMSERGIQKWETTVTEALVKLRDFGEKRCAPALQRLFLVFDELLGWGKLPDFAIFQLPLQEIQTCRNLASRGILAASWLAGEARKELSRFREFIAWLRFEVNTIVLPSDASQPRHDILEVNNYFISGLAKSSIDAWFIGSVPNFELQDLHIPESDGTTLSQAILQARDVLKDPSQTAWQMTVTENDLTRLDRNLEALIQELADRCQRVFHHAAGAASRSAIVSSDPKLNRQPEEERRVQQPLAFPFRDRSVLNKDGEWFQHLVVHLPTEDDKPKILVAQLRVSLEAGGLPSAIGIAILECYLPEEGEEDTCAGLLDADFFDDESIVIVYRLRKEQNQAFIATLRYNDIGYHNLSDDAYVKSSAREDLMQHSLELWKSGQIASTKLPINRRRVLYNCQSGGVSLALNGRTGRRVACVLDSTGTTLESFDLEGDAEDMEVADDARAD